MNEAEMARLFQVHREAEARRDYDAVLETFSDDCYSGDGAVGPSQRGPGGGPGGLRRLLHRLPRPRPR